LQTLSEVLLSASSPVELTVKVVAARAAGPAGVRKTIVAANRLMTPIKMMCEDAGRAYLRRILLRGM
jgi:predicted metal-binding transcription factor (methanogenesis marker protein 9)